MRTATTSRGTAAGTTHRRPRARVLRRYRDGDGATRELIARPGAHGSLLVLDRDLLRRDEARLVAHLGGDEPAANAMVAANAFAAADPRARRCRLFEERDARTSPFPEDVERLADVREADMPAVDAADGSFRLQSVPGAVSIPSLRWTRCPSESCGPGVTVSLREAIAAIESYEPLCALTRGALARHGDDPAVSCTVLRTELGRVLDSPIVLNRRLREAVLAKVRAGEASMSEIAIRCGRLKHDSRGNTTGETSWLARRVGLLPEGGHEEPTRWVHTEVLALIARDGLGIAPREVELG